MNTFFQGLQFGFAQGMLNNMFGGFSSFGFGPFGFSSFNFSPFGFGSFGFNPFSMGMNFGMSMFSMPMMNYGYYTSSPSIFMSAPAMPTSQMSADSFINPRMVTYTPETTAEFTDVFVPSYISNPFPSMENKPKEPELTVEEREKLEEEREIKEILDLHDKWSKKDISKDAELTPQFCDKVVDIAHRVKCNPDDLMALMYSECRFNHKAVNDANVKENVGLIQFGADTRKELGITKEQLLNMSAIEQLDYVEKYIKTCKQRLGYSDDDKLSLGTLAAMIFRPRYANKEVLARRGSDAYKKNYQLDSNKDGKITKTELAERLKKYQ